MDGYRRSLLLAIAIVTANLPFKTIAAEQTVIED